MVHEQHTIAPIKHTYLIDNVNADTFDKAHLVRLKYTYVGFNPSSASPVFMRDGNFVITVPTDVLIPDGTRPSANKYNYRVGHISVDILVAIKYFEYIFTDQMMSFKIQNGHQNLLKSPHTSSVRQGQIPKEM